MTPAPTSLRAPVDVAVVGSINLDESITLERAPLPGETVLAEKMQIAGGGKGANQAVAAARAGGARTSLIACTGADSAAEMLRHSLAGDQIALALQHHDGPTGRALVLLSSSGENSIVVLSGANAHLRDITTGEGAQHLATAAVILVQLETPAYLIEQAAAVKRPGGTLMVNAAPALPIPEHLWAMIDLLVVNEHEASIYTGISDPVQAADTLVLRVDRVFVTMGSRGSRYVDRNGREEDVPALTISAVDTTGAGDTYCGVLAAHLSRGRTCGWR